MDSGNFILLLFPVMLAMMIASYWWPRSRTETIVRKWADENGYTLISVQWRWFFQGPFFWRKSENQTVCRIEVVDPQGQHRFGWIRCGGWFFGLFSSAVKVKWDD